MYVALWAVDEISVYYQAKYMDEVVCHSNTNNMAIRCFQEYFTQSFQQVFDMQRVEPYRSRGTVCFDSGYKRVPYDKVESGGPGMCG